jgi:hypothetical protein
MALWVTADNTAATKILAVSLLLDETEESFQFSCECFLDCFRKAPAVIFTDSDPAIKAAIEAVFPVPLTAHLLCIWHLSKNLFSNVRAACGTDDALWQRIMSGWWVIVKQSDESSRETFDAEWSALVALLDGTAVTGKSVATARKWLDKMAANREQWAARWTWRFFTLGIHSTQRIEAVHSAVAGFLRASTLLTALLAALESHGAHVASSAATRTFRHIRLNQAAAKCHSHPIIDAAASLLSPYALMLLKAQLQQAAFYTVTETETPGTVKVTRAWPAAPAAAAEDDAEDADVGLASARFSLARTTTAGGCSCQFSRCYGIPCRHQLRYLDLKQLLVPEALYHIRWRMLDGERVRVLTEDLLRCRPPRRAGAADPAALTRDDRYLLAMAACRGAAELAAASDTSYAQFRSDLARLVAGLRKPAPAAPGAPRRRAAHAALAAAGAGGAGSGALDGAGSGALDGEAGGSGGAGPASKATATKCGACGQLGHRKSNTLCPRFGQLSLPAPDQRARARRADDDDSDSGANETVCHVCSNVGDLVCCGGCPHSYHHTCLPADAMDLDEESWLCPVCNGSSQHAGFFGSPQTGRRTRQQARKRPRAEGTKAHVAQNKAARRLAAPRPYR